MRIKEEWISFYTLFRREIIRIIRIWPQTILPPIITMSLYFIIFGNLIGSRIGLLHGYSYVEYIMPGLVMMSIINNAYLNTTSSFFGNKFQRNIEEMLVAPMSNHMILLGYVCGAVVRGLIIGMLVVCVSLFFTRITVHNWPVTIMVAFFTAALFALAGMVNGILAKKFDDISIIPVFILTPLTYLGGVFYAVDMLPSFWRAITYLNPVFYMINAFRYSLLGESDVSLMYALTTIFGAVVILYLLNLWLLNRGIGVKS